MILSFQVTFVKYVLVVLDLDSIRKRVDAATPGPWGYNSYSRVDANPLIEHYDDPDTPEYPDGKRPGRISGTFFDEADNAWLAQHHAAYEADPMVAEVPAEYGDTATGRHAADAEFIAHARTDMPTLLDKVEQLKNVLRQLLEWDHLDGSSDGAYWRGVINHALDKT